MKLDIAAILQVGLAGLAFLLALLSYNLLAREQRSSKPRPEMIGASRTFFLLCIALALVVGGFQLVERVYKPVDVELVERCGKTLDDMRVESRNAKTLDQLRAAVGEQDAACRKLLAGLEKK